MASFGASDETALYRPVLNGDAMSDNLTFGLTLTIVGMSGTLLSLWALSLLTSLLKKIFPLTREKPAPGTEK